MEDTLNVQDSRGESTPDLAQTLADIQVQNDKQLSLMKRQVFFTQLFAFISLGVFVLLLVTVVFVGPKVNQILTRANDLTIQISDISEKAEVVLGNLETVSNQLTDTDYNQMLENVNALIQDSQTTLNEALLQIKLLDIATLNSSIKDLDSIIRPLAELMNGLQ